MTQFPDHGLSLSYVSVNGCEIVSGILSSLTQVPGHCSGLWLLLKQNLNLWLLLTLCPGLSLQALPMLECGCSLQLSLVPDLIDKVLTLFCLELSTNPVGKRAVVVLHCEYPNESVFK